MSTRSSRTSHHIINFLSFNDLCSRFISTMETETVSSRNIVDLLLNEEFNTNICGALSTSGSESIDSKLDSENDTTRTNEATMTDQDKDDYVYGWDC